MRYIFLISVFILSLGAVSGSIKFSEFHASPVEESKILVEWVTIEEVNVKEYYVQRSYQRSGNFVTVSKVIEANGPNRYRFKDTVTLKSENKSRIYYYRLKFVNHDNTFGYSKVIEAVAHVSSARQTWGKLKAMFH